MVGLEGVPVLVLLASFLVVTIYGKKIATPRWYWTTIVFYSLAVGFLGIFVVAVVYIWMIMGLSSARL